MCRGVLICMLIAFPVFGEKVEGDMKTMAKSHAALCAEADASVEQVREQVAKDPRHPLFHVTAASRFINDPNGPVYFNGLYHLFFQHLPFYETDVPSTPYWGHVVSKDLVHWAHWPVAMAPVPGTYDAGACASGSCVINNGVPTIVYTSVPPQAQSLAMSHDNLRTWTRYDQNPVIAVPPPIKDLDEGFRDPYVWKEDGNWFMAIGSGVKGQGGTILLYRSPDLVQWTFLRQLCTGTDADCFQWECPNFFRLQNRHVLLVSPLYHSLSALRGPVQYATGPYADYAFTPGSWHLMDLGGPENFYAPNSLVDQKGRRILWGWIMVGGSPGYPWHGAITLPRVLTLRKDGTLCMKPLPELKSLRGRYWRNNATIFGTPGATILEKARGNALEIRTRVKVGSEAVIGLDVFVSEDAKRMVPVRFDRERGILKVGDKENAFSLTEQENDLRLHLFIDRSVLELYVNDRVCFTAQANPNPADQRIRLVVEKGTAAFGAVEVWEMKSIWESP